MATRWEKLREHLKPIIDKEEIDPTDIPTVDLISYATSFDCGKCKYLDKEHGKLLCNSARNSINCREGYADYLNSDVGGE